MVIRIECESHDYSSGENLINQFEVTTKKGVSTEDLKAAELSKCRGVWNIHARTHPGHSATYSFSIPEGYKKRGGIIYKSK